MQVEVRRAGERFVSRYDGVESRHSFSFGVHYDPANVGFGILVCNNDDVLGPTKGYDAHPHRDLEIVTWVLEGELRHEDSTGHRGVVRPGVVQRLSAGSGVVHSEVAGPAGSRFVQMWVPADEPGAPPGYDDREVVLDEGLCTVASGLAGHAPAVRLGNSGAALHAARLRGGSVGLPDAAYLHVYVCSGRARLVEGPVLEEGDAARLTGAAGVEVTGDAEILAWEMRRGR
jgi:quercetin 2,3-dioxygenase